MEYQKRAKRNNFDSLNRLKEQIKKRKDLEKRAKAEKRKAEKRQRGWE